MSKKKKTVKNVTKKSFKNINNLPTDLGTNLKKPTKLNTMYNSQSTKNSLIEDFNHIKIIFFERSFIDFQLKMKSRALQNSIELPDMLDIILRDAENLENLGKELKLYWNNYQSMLTIPQINYSKKIRLNNEIRNLFHQNSQAESK